jgi:hypothetical protein
LSFAASGAVQKVISAQKAPRAFPVAKKAVPERISLEQWERENRAKALPSTPVVAPAVGTDGTIVEAAILPQVPAGSGEASLKEVAAEVGEASEDGSAWKNFVAHSDDDRRRLADRREEDRRLLERRALEAEKKRLERELELRTLAEKFREQDRQAAQSQRDEDRRRIQSRVDEDRRSTEERDKKTQQLAEAPPNEPNRP